MSDAYNDASMLELFRMEARTQTDALNAGLLALERQPTDAAHLESCMRAAHSLKGAARIVNLSPAVPVAHVMEDCLVLAQSGRLRIGPAHIDALLAGSDLLLQLAQPPEPGQAHGVDQSAIDHYVARVAALPGMDASGTSTPGAQPDLDMSGGSAPATQPAWDTPNVSTSAAQPARDMLGGSAPATQPAWDTPNVSTSDTQPARDTSDVSAPAVHLARADAKPVDRAAEVSDEDDEAASDRMLRVTATALNTLLGLSSETMVESRWLTPFSKSLLAIKRQQDQSLAALDAMRAVMQEQGVDAQLLARLEDVRTRMSGTRSALAGRVEELERFDWRLTHLGQRLYDTALACRMRPLDDVVSGLPRFVRDLGRELGKQVRLEIVGARTRVDRDVLARLEAPLAHLLRNAVDHGIESAEQRAARGKPPEGTVTLEARHSAGTLMIEVSDDGGGIDLSTLRTEVVSRELASPETASKLDDDELLEFLFLPGFSTRSRVTQTSGRGVGLDAVQNAVRALRGDITISQEPGAGTRFSLSLPLSLSVVRALLIEVAGEPYALPLAYVMHTLVLPLAQIQQLEGHQHFDFEGKRLGLVLASQLLGTGSPLLEHDDQVRIVVLGDESQAFGVAVDRFLGERSLVVQALDPRLGKVQDVACAALLEDGSPVLVLDAEDLQRSIEKLVTAGRLAGLGRGQTAGTAQRHKRVLVVDDSLTVRELQRKLLVNRGYEVTVAVDGMDGWNILHAESFDMVITDVDMPRMDGVELVTLLKRDTRLASIPVMIVSYKDRPEDRQRGLDAGADYYLAKSNFHDEALLNIVEDLIGSPDQ